MRDHARATATQMCVDAAPKDETTAASAKILIYTVILSPSDVRPHHPTCRSKGTRDTDMRVHALRRPQTRMRRRAEEVNDVRCGKHAKEGCRCAVLTGVLSFVTPTPTRHFAAAFAKRSRAEMLRKKINHNDPARQSLCCAARKTMRTTPLMKRASMRSKRVMLMSVLWHAKIMPAANGAKQNALQTGAAVNDKR